MVTSNKRCPDCGHHVDVHDQFGCVMVRCNPPCELSGEFLIEYYQGDPA